MGKLAKLPTKVRQEVVAELEHLLERARAGEVLGVVITAELTEHRIRTFGDFYDGFTMLGHLARQMAVVNHALQQEGGALR